MSRTTTTKSLLLAAFSGVAAAVAAPVATAAAPPPKPKSSAVAQYVEMVPTSSGSTAPGIGKSTSKPLPKGTSTALRAAVPASAAALEAVSTSSAYGAPTTTLPADTRAKPPAPKPAAPKPSAGDGGSPATPHQETPQAHDTPPSALSGTSLAAGVRAAGSGGDRILVFGLALLGLGAAMVATAARRRQF